MREVTRNSDTNLRRIKRISIWISPDIKTGCFFPSRPGCDSIRVWIRFCRKLKELLSFVIFNWYSSVKVVNWKWRSSFLVNMNKKWSSRLIWKTRSEQFPKFKVKHSEILVKMKFYNNISSMDRTISATVIPLPSDKLFHLTVSDFRFFVNKHSVE